MHLFAKAEVYNVLYIRYCNAGLCYVCWEDDLSVAWREGKGSVRPPVGGGADRTSKCFRMTCWQCSSDQITLLRRLEYWHLATPGYGGVQYENSVGITLSTQQLLQRVYLKYARQEDQHWAWRMLVLEGDALSKKGQLLKWKFEVTIDLAM